MEEIWKDIIGFEGLYQFSNLYRVKSLPKPGSHKEILRIYMGGDGYPRIGLRKNGRYYVRKIHRLVLEYFIGPRPLGMECRHLNDLKTDYRIENLKWGTHKKNMEDFENRINREKFYHRNDVSGYKIIEIEKLLAEGKLTQKEIGKRYGISPQRISDIKTGKRLVAYV